MKRRKFLIGAGSLAAGSAAAMGTGAFDSVQADRDITVTVANDQNAYLSFVDLDDDYAKYDDKGRLTLNFGKNDNGGQGLNQEADTRINDVFTIQNQGTDSVYIWIASDKPESGAAQSTQVLAGNSDLTDGGDTQGYITLNPGKSTTVDFLFNVTGSLDPRTEMGVFQFRATDTSNGEPTWVGDYERDGDQAGDNGNDIFF